MTPLFQHIFPRRTLTHTTRLVCERAARGRRVKNDPHPPTPLHPFPKMGFVVTYDRLYVRAYVTTEYMCIWRTARRESRLQRDHSSVTSHTRECLHAPPSDHRRTSHVIRPITGVPTHTRTQRSNPSGANLDFCQVGKSTGTIFSRVQRVDATDADGRVRTRSHRTGARAGIGVPSPTHANHPSGANRKTPARSLERRARERGRCIGNATVHHSGATFARESMCHGAGMDATRYPASRVACKHFCARRRGANLWHRDRDRRSHGGGVYTREL